MFDVFVYAVAVGRTYVHTPRCVYMHANSIVIRVHEIDNEM